MEYTQTVMNHFFNPRNMGEIKDADGIGMVGNVRCGDIMYVYIKVGVRKAEDKSSEYIEDIKFKTLGCAAAIATSSMMTEMVKGKALEEAAKISKDDINTALGTLPQQKYHCSILSAEGIHKAIDDYRQKQLK